MRMNYEQYKHHLRDCFIATTGKDKSKKGYNCPCCPSGTGKNGTGVTVDDQKHTWKCWSCGSGGDIYDLIGQHEVITEKAEQYKRIEALYGTPATETVKQQCQANKNLSQTDYPKSRGISNDLGIYQSSSSETTYQAKQPKSEVKPLQPKHDYSDYIDKCVEKLTESEKAMEYLSKTRGFTEDIIKRFRLGYDSDKDAVVVPYNSESTYFISRSIGENNYRKPKLDEAGTEPLFNAEALNSEEFVFVTEGAFDAISFEQLGYRSVALGGIGAGKLIAAISGMKQKPRLILALDNDDSGKDASVKLEKTLQEHEVEFMVFAYPEGAKDANEALNRDRNGFTENIKKTIHAFECSENEKKSEFLKKSNFHYCNQFFEDIKAGAFCSPITTGFEKLDEIFDGGINNELYIVGAISSLGKTTLVTQIADQIAGSKKVLFFSLEMAREEIIARSISRHMFQIANVEFSGYSIVEDAKTSRNIRRGKTSDGKGEELVSKATESYLKYASNIFVHEGVGNIGAKEIRKEVYECTKVFGEAPVVFVDYLQLLAPYEVRATDKQNTDKAVLELKRISRDFNIPVIAISSLNRQSYKQSISMEAFKESGAIEYSSDVLIGLQFKKVVDDDFNVDVEKAKEERDVELVILKNRNGRSGEKISFKYYAMFNCFSEA